MKLENKKKDIERVFSTPHIVIHQYQYNVIYHMLHYKRSNNQDKVATTKQNLFKMYNTFHTSQVGVRHSATNIIRA